MIALSSGIFTSTREPTERHATASRIERSAAAVSCTAIELKRVCARVNKVERSVRAERAAVASRSAVLGKPRFMNALT